MRTSNDRTSGLSRWRAVLGTALLLATSLVGVTVAIGSPAQAACVGSRVPVNSYFDPQNRLVAREDTRTGTSATCDGLSDYYGRVMDALDGDGKCAYAVWADPSMSVAGSDCSSYTWANYSAWDQQGNSSANFDLCVSYNCAGEYAPFRVYNF